MIVLRKDLDGCWYGVSPFIAGIAGSGRTISECKQCVNKVVECYSALKYGHELDDSRQSCTIVWLMDFGSLLAYGFNRLKNRFGR